MLRRSTTGIFVSLTASFAFAWGCGSSSDTVKMPLSNSHGDHDGHDHGSVHPTEGPHHGHLIELGNEEFHLELVDDHKTHTVTVYVLDKTAKVNAPIDSKELAMNLTTDGKPAQFLFPSAPQKDDPEGKASRFQLVDKKLCIALDAKSTQGRMNVTINDKPYSGKLSHSGHEGHKH